MFSRSFLGWFALLSMFGCSEAGSTELTVTVDHRICQALVFEVGDFEHETILSPEDFLLPTMKGTIRSRAGEWPNEVKLSLEIRVLPTGQRVVFDHLNPDSSFSYPELLPGAYCYKVMAPGWKSLVGLVELRGGRVDQESMDLVLPLAE